MRPFHINGETWGVIRVPAGDPRLIDRTGTERLAVTDQHERMVYVNGRLVPPLLDKVMLHEVAHAITVTYGLLGYVRERTPESVWVDVEEWNAQILENHALEALGAARESLGRPVCVRGLCFD